jgi:hypothetical protein
VVNFIARMVAIELSFHIKSGKDKPVKAIL